MYKYSTMSTTAWRRVCGDEGLDRAGTVASSVCAAHCVVCAVLPAAFGVLGLGFLTGHGAEWTFTLVAVAFAIGALHFGWRRHRSRGIALLMVLAIVGLLASRGIEGVEPHHDGEHHHDEHHHVASAEPPGSIHLAGTALGVLAGLMLATGHVLNIRASRRCCPPSTGQLDQCLRPA
ncbi:MerC mercury resistance protein [Enhygromyxa salina]|uniref:MerC mercury resistance protein n=2 Tax=Enhygromyxa salina TaxID=215803 RepID=A0A2S9XEI9_9BACT|nr:MerC mercury resistance protein [Enhygromyxa salina]